MNNLIIGIAGGSGRGDGVKIMSCQIMGNSTTGGKGNPTVKAFEYAWTNGAIIAQNSWGYNLETADGTKITPEEFEREWKSNYGIMRDAIDTFVRGAGTRGYACAGNPHPAAPAVGKCGVRPPSIRRADRYIYYLRRIII